LCKDWHVDVAAREDQAHTLAGISVFLLEQSRERCSTGALGQIVRRRIVDADNLRDFLLANENDAGSAILDDLERLGQRVAAGQSVRERPRRIGLEGSTGFE
jgi:hypothetical protein